MHIPDGYLSPSTCAITYGIMIPFWYKSLKNLSKSYNVKKIPFLALASAFTFVIMMFNIPIPGGTSGHAVGATLLTIAFGLDLTILAISLALFVQSLVFGDGGITAFGANSLIMGVIMPYVGYSIYTTFIKKKNSIPFKLLSSFVASYISIIFGAISVAILIGIQPILFKDENNLPLYSPFPIKIALPAMLIEHLFLFGFIEGIATVIILKYLLKFEEEGVIELKEHISKKLAISIVILTFLSPLGIIIPYIFNSSGAWGEWGSEELKEKLNFIPEGLKKLENIYKAPFPDYSFPFLNKEGLIYESIFYILSGFIGILTILILTIILKSMIKKKNVE